MAKARLVPVKPVNPSVMLELSHEEADAILCVLGGFIAGDPDNSPRKHTGAVAEALSEALDCDFGGTEAYQYLGYKHGVTFIDY